MQVNYFTTQIRKQKPRAETVSSKASEPVHRTLPLGFFFYSSFWIPWEDWRKVWNFQGTYPALPTRRRAPQWPKRTTGSFRTTESSVGGLSEGCQTGRPLISRHQDQCGPRGGEISHVKKRQVCQSPYWDPELYSQESGPLRYWLPSWKFQTRSKEGCLQLSH